MAHASRWDVIQGDCLDVMRSMPDASVDAVVTDPPYELAFMSKGWDRSGIANSVEMWADVIRVLKPGGHLLAFGGTRTYHRMVCAIEDAGFRIVDTLIWLRGQGFPKSHSLLKPAWEPITMAARPGPRTLRIDACRIDGAVDSYWTPGNAVPRNVYGEYSGNYSGAHQPHPDGIRHGARGRWPANVILDEAAAAALDAAVGERKSSGVYTNVGQGTGEGATYMPVKPTGAMYSDTGGPSRYFFVAPADEVTRFHYEPKASRAERNAGLPEGLTNSHPCVKSVNLMRWLCRLVTPPDGLILDPFCGSGSTGCAAMLEGFRFIGIDADAHYCDLARARIQHYAAQPTQLTMVAD